MEYPDEIYPLHEESYKIIGICMEVHRILGRGFLEVVYKDALEIEFRQNDIPYQREKKFEISYKGHQLHRSYNADFVVFDKILLEIKAQNGIIGEHYKWVTNYLAVTKLPLGLLVNFGEKSLISKRIIL